MLNPDQEEPRLLRVFGPHWVLLKFVPAEGEDRFRDTLSKKKFRWNDVEAGRKYVEAYVSLLEYLEHLSSRDSQ